MKLIYFSNTVLNENNLDTRGIYISQAGKLRSQYIIGAIKKCNAIRDIVFLSQAPGTSGGIQHRIEKTHDTICFKEVYLGYFGKGIIQWITSIISTTLWFLTNTNRQDTVIVYNFSPRMAIPIIFSKFFKNYKLIVQFEELYGHMESSYRYIFLLLERFSMRYAIGFITSSNLISNIVRKSRGNNIPIVMSYGYPTISVISNPTPPISSKRLQLLYSGTLDSQRGILNLITLLQYVNDFADLTIIGQGPLSATVKKLSQTNNNLRYFGYVNDDMYSNILSKMHVCINPTPNDSDFSKYSFPSKVTYYISNFKIVLSTPLEVIKNSPYRDIIVYYDEKNPICFRKKLLEIYNNIDNLTTDSKNFSLQIERIRNQEYQNICDLISKQR